MVGSTVTHYRILSVIGRGGMGEVYEAEDLNLQRRVAVKFLNPERARKPEAIERFRREARMASALNHPHICTVHEIGESQGQYFIVTELLRGRDLQWISGWPSPRSRACRIPPTLSLWRKTALPEPGLW
jgi:serine/threonine protein kinase